ncbi:MAG: hypothetical protein ABIN01_12835, partial [Ferruginibacter sp.]
NRFSNGIELHEHIVRNSISAAGNIEWGADRIAKLERENEKLIKENASLLEKINDYDQLNNRLTKTLQKNTSDTKTFFSPKNILIILLSLLITGFIIERLFFNRNTTRQNGNSVSTLDTNNAPNTSQDNIQLGLARNFLMSGRVEEAKLIYKALAIQDIPEAMFEYANLVLLNENDKSNCAEAIEYLKRSVTKGYAPAKRTLGLLYSLPDDDITLKQQGYQGCSFTLDIPRGAKLLMEASLEGDTSASRLIDELNLKYGRQ